MSQWYYAQQGQRLGPISQEELVALIQSGQVRPADVAWTQGMAQWVAVGNIPELAPPVDPNVPPPMPGYSSSYALYSQRCAAKTSGVLWKVLIFVGAALLFIGFFVPWWGVRVNMDKDAMENIDLEKVGKLMEKAKKAERWNKDWYDKHKVDERLERARDGKDKASVWLWGWNVASGILGLIFVFIILPLTIVPMFVKVVQPWNWVGAFVTAILGIVLLVLALVWLFGAPGSEDSVPPLFSQGIIIGPWLFLLASLLILGGSVTDGVFGLLALLRSLTKVPKP